MFIGFSQSSCDLRQLALPTSDTWKNVKIKVMARQVATISQPTRPRQGCKLHDHCTFLSVHFLAAMILPTLTVVVCG